jgi:D-arabinose 1-dehydrogenase-like Zn-dependent alcohol dehydrogenase
LQPPWHRFRYRTDPIQKVNEAYERVLASDVRYRFVIDMATLK